MASKSTLRVLLARTGDFEKVADGCDGVDTLTDGERDDETSLPQELETLSVSRRLVRSVRLKWMRKSRNGAIGARKVGNHRNFSSRCLSLYGRGGGCKVGSCEEFEFNSRRKSGSMEECIPSRGMVKTERVGLECFRKKTVRKEKEIEQPKPCATAEFQFLLPDDVLEMCLVRLPLTALLTSRLVCKKWRCLTTAPHFMQMRSKGLHQTPWLLLFGIIKDGCYAGEIRALDIAMDRWHRIPADVLQGRFLFSVTSIRTDLYVIGGCSNLNRYGPAIGGGSLKTHKGVFVFSPLTGSWCKAASMKSARSAPVLGVFEVSSSCAAFQTQPERQEHRFQRSRIGGVSDVYEDPHRCSVRRRLRDALGESDNSPDFKHKPSIGQERNGGKKCALIAVGGHGSWDEPLDSGEIYDPVTNRWIEIAQLPGDFGAACSAAVCNGVFYVYSEADKLAGYNLERGIWVVIQTSCPPPRLREYFPKLVCCNNRLFLFSVSWCERDRQLYRREKAVRKLWELNLMPFSWTEVSRHPDAPMDCDAAFVGGRNRIYGVEMFKIFGQVLDFLTVCDVSDMEVKWSRISGKHVAHEADASSCTTKTMAMLHL